MQRDAAPPRVVAATPQDAAALTAPPTQLRVQFNEPVNLSQLAYQSYQQAQTGQLTAVFLRGADGVQYYPRLTSYDPDTNEALFLMLDALPNMAYELHLSAAGGLTDLAGNPLVGNDPSGDYVVRFTVAGTARGTAGNPLLWTSQEPNDTPSQPQALGVLFPRELTSGVLIVRDYSADPASAPADSADYYQFEVIQRRPYFFNGRPAGTQLTLRNSAGNLVSLTSQQSGAVFLANLQPGTYVLGLSGWNAANAASLTYQLRITMGGSPENPTPLSLGPSPAYRIRLVTSVPPPAPPSTPPTPPANPDPPAANPDPPAPSGNEEPTTTGETPPPLNDEPPSLPQESPPAPTLPLVTLAVLLPPAVEPSLTLNPIVAAPPVEPLPVASLPVAPTEVAVPPPSDPPVSTPPAPTEFSPALPLLVVNTPPLPPAPPLRLELTLPVTDPLPRPVLTTHGGGEVTASAGTPGDVLAALRGTPLGGVRGAELSSSPPAERLAFRPPQPAPVEAVVRLVMLTQAPSEQQGGSGLEPSSPEHAPRAPTASGDSPSKSGTAGNLPADMRQYLRQLERLWRTTVNDLFRLEWSPGRPEESAPGSPEQSAPRDDHGAEPNSAALWQDQDADADARLTSTATTPSWAWLGVGLGLALPAVADHKQRTDESAGAAEEKRRTIAAA